MRRVGIGRTGGGRRHLLVVVGAAFLLASCGNAGDDAATDRVGEDPAEEVAPDAGTTDDDAAANDVEDDASGAEGDLESLSGVEPTDRAFVTAGDAEVMLTSFCGQSIGDGVELVGAGLEPGVILEGRVNGQPLQAPVAEDGTAYQALVNTAETYEVELDLPDIAEPAVELDGCG